MMLADTRESGTLERQVVERALPAVDGVVLTSPRMGQPGSRMSAKVKPIVVLNRPVAGVPGVGTDSPFRPAVTGGLRAAGDFSAAPTSAALACNDQLATGLIGALTKDGARIPDEVSVIGFDDIVASGLVSPAPTTMAPPPRTMGAWP